MERRDQELSAAIAGARPHLTAWAGMGPARLRTMRTSLLSSLDGHLTMLSDADVDLKSSIEDVSRRQNALGCEEAAHASASPEDVSGDWEELSSLQEEIESLRAWCDLLGCSLFQRFVKLADTAPGAAGA